MREVAEVPGIGSSAAKMRVHRGRQSLRPRLEKLELKLMQCVDLAERLTDFLEGELGEPEQAAALKHLASCPRCETVLAETRDGVEHTATHGRLSLSDADRRRILSFVVDAIEDSPSS